MLYAGRKYPDVYVGIEKVLLNLKKRLTRQSGYATIIIVFCMYQLNSQFL